MNKLSNSVTVSIYGGLGNQLFQYSVGRALAVRNDCRLWLDARHYATHPQFKFGLQHFNIQASTAEVDQLPPERSRWLRHFAWRLLASATAVRERGLSFDPSVLDRRGNLYLRGYWQTEKYFCERADLIRSELTFRNPPENRNAEMISQICTSPSIGLHIRRGDYVSNARANQVHGTCSIDYYRSGVDYILQNSQSSKTVFVFSDDPEWVKRNLRIDSPTVYVDHNSGDAAHEDLRLMSACQHQVISNSTFSWWAAWLNRNPTKIVVAPENWFADPTKRNVDILPENWHRIGHQPALAKSA